MSSVPPRREPCGWCACPIPGAASQFSASGRRTCRRIEPYFLQLPGREDRIREPLYREWQGMAQDAVEALLPVADRPVVLFGHSLGAMIALDLARGWRSTGRGCSSTCLFPRCRGRARRAAA